MQGNRAVVILGTVLAVGVVGFVFVSSLGRLVPMTSTDEATSDEETPCRLESGPCSAGVDGLELTLEASPRPIIPFEPVVFSLTAPGLDAETVVIDLQMPDMQMGENTVQLARVEAGVWRGEGVVPACPSGRTLWEATVIVPGKGRAPFGFHIEAGHGR